MTRRRVRPMGSGLLGWAALLVVLSTAPYLSGLGNGPVLDDGAVSWNHPAVRGLGGQSAWSAPFAWGAADAPWRPLATWSFAWGDGSAGSRRGHYTLQIALRSLSGLLMFLLLWRTLRSIPAAFIWGLLFVALPGASEAVFRLAGRAHLLGLVFSLAAVLVYVWGREASEGRDPGRPGLLATASASVLYLLALLSSELTWSLPLVLLSFEWIRTGAGGKRKRGARPALTRLTPVAPFAVIFAGWLVLQATVDLPLEGEMAGGVVPWMGLGPKLAGSLAVLGTYLRLFLIPLDLSTSHVHILGPEGIPGWTHLTGGAIAAAGLGVLIWRVRKGDRRLAAWGFAWWLLALLPCLPLLRRTGPFASEMFLVLPAAGLALGLGAMTSRWMQSWRSWVVLGLAAVCFLFGLRTVSRASDMRTDATLFEKQLAAHPDNSEFLYRRGTELLSAKKWIEAQSPLLAATDELKIDPRTWINLGISLQADENYGLAVRALVSAQRLVDKTPRFRTLGYRAYYHLGLALASQGRDERAAWTLERALEYRPGSLPIIANLGFIYARNRTTRDKALDYLNRALELESDPAKQQELRKVIEEAETGEPGHEGHDHP